MEEARRTPRGAMVVCWRCGGHGARSGVEAARRAGVVEEAAAAAAVLESWNRGVQGGVGNRGAALEAEGAGGDVGSRSRR